MRLNKRIEKIEEKLNGVEQLTGALLTFSDEDEAEQISQFKAENPGRPYETIRIRFIEPESKLKKPFRNQDF